MQIAPGVDAGQWHNLNLDDPESPDWMKAIDIFKSRMCGRFIDPTDCLIDTERAKPAPERCFGFAVLALDCMLLETLAAFRKGLRDTNGKCKSIFREFLSTRPQFRDGGFTEALSTRFYEEFRCGILHQTETCGDSRVWSVGPIVCVDGDKMIVNRTEFHERLKAEFQGYLQELQDPKKIGLRSNFRRKMDFISRK